MVDIRTLRREASLQFGRIKLPHRNVAAFGLILGVVLGAILAVPLTGASLVEPAKPSPVTLQAPQSLSFTSEVSTRALQVQRENAVQPVYHTDASIVTQQRRALAESLDAVDEIRNNAATSRDQQVAALTALTAPAITETLALTLLDFEDDEWQRITSESEKLYDLVLRSENYALTEQDIANIRERVLPTTPELPRVSSAQREVILYFVSSFLKPNEVLDEALTEQRRLEAREAVDPVRVSVVEGENVVRRGDIVTEADYEKLTKLGLVHGAGGLTATLQMALLGALIAWLFASYVNYFQESIWHNDRALLVVVVLLAVTLLAARLLIPSWESAPYAFPFATMSILLTVLFNAQLALVATFALAPLVGLQHSQFAGLAVPLALGAMAGIFTAQGARRTGTFAWVGLVVATVTALASLVFWIGPNNEGTTVPEILLFSLVNGALSGVLAVGSYHFLGRVANVVTPLELMELAHPNQPLLRRLMREAPGTYHHSMVVSNLAEVAAENIGADPLLTRVGAYYHDVGKLLRPYFFTDNQHDRSNVHDVLDPKTSATIIIDHVREGAKLALDNGLPQRVVDFIPQHHGTNLVSFFYQRALQEDEDADIEMFRYPGPKPQTREAAIMMLADGVEATVRAKAQAGKLKFAHPEENGDARPGQTIGEIVDQIVNERIAAQQLDEAPLTLRDIAVIKQSFVQTLQGIYHPRVDYPQLSPRAVAESPAA